MEDSLCIASSPVERVSSQNCEGGIHDSVENVATWTSWDISVTTYVRNTM